MDSVIDAGNLICPPIVVTELVSDSRLPPDQLRVIASIPSIPLTEGYWIRAGLLRASVLEKGYKAALADALIAQSCIDADVPLITLDRDFRHFVRYGGLKLAN